MKYTFVRSIHDLDNTKYLGKNVTITMQELPERTPTMVLMCAEPSSLMTKGYSDDHGHIDSSGIDHRG